MLCGWVGDKGLQIRQLTEDFRKWENAACCFIGSDTQKTFQEYQKLLKLSTDSSLLLDSFSLISKPRCSSRMFWVHVYRFREQWMATQTKFLRSISARWTINKKDSASMVLRNKLVPVQSRWPLLLGFKKIVME